jgi:hypothetical protein
MQTAASPSTGSYHSAFSAQYNGSCILTAANTSPVPLHSSLHFSHIISPQNYNYIQSYNKPAITVQSGKRNLDRTSGLAPIVDVLECVYHKFNIRTSTTTTHLLNKAINNNTIISYQIHGYRKSIRYKLCLLQGPRFFPPDVLVTSLGHFACDTRENLFYRQRM